jgi:hypothetical protein
MGTRQTRQLVKNRENVHMSLAMDAASYDGESSEVGVITLPQAQVSMYMPVQVANSV